MDRMLVKAFLAIAVVFFSGFTSLGQTCKPAEEVVGRVFVRFLKRNPNPGPNDWWVCQLKRHGLTVKQMIRGFAWSKEYQDKLSNLSDPKKIERLYADILGRTVNITANNFWVQRLPIDGWFLIVNGFVDSDEYAKSYGDWSVPGPLRNRIKFCPGKFPLPANQCQDNPPDDDDDDTPPLITCTVCAGDRPDGWVITNRRTSAFRSCTHIRGINDRDCPPNRLGNVIDIRKVAGINWPKGYTLTICASSGIPSGWKFYDTRTDLTKCGTNQSLNNLTIIKKE